MDTSCGDSTNKSRFNKVGIFIILCVMLAIGAREAAAMQASENRQIWEEARQIRQETSDDNAVNEVGGGSPGASVDAPAPREMASLESLELPKNLRVPDNMRPVLVRMLRSSATFRRQVAILTAKPAVRVSVAYGGLRGDRHYHALSTVKKHEWGAMVVDTTVFVPTDLVEIIAHELEHVCEQMEGVDLRGLSRQKGHGVFDLNGHFETARAIRAGQEATREYHDGPEGLQQTIRIE